MGGERSPLPHQLAVGMSLPSSLILEPGRGEALRGNRSEGRLTAGSSQEGLQLCAGERRAAPRKAGRGKWAPT